LLAAHANAAAGDDILQALKPVTDAMLAKPAPEDWLTRRGDYRAWGYSGLAQIYVGECRPPETRLGLEYGAWIPRRGSAGP
jgi:hypothetical protein